MREYENIENGCKLSSHLLITEGFNLMTVSNYSDLESDLEMMTSLIALNSDDGSVLNIYGF